MKLARIAILSGILVAIPVGAAEPGLSAAEVARQTMREAMMKQAAMPVHHPGMPGMKPDGGAPAPVTVPPAKGKNEAARQKAMGAGMRDADAIRAEMANRAAHGGATGKMMQTSGDMMNAPMMQRAQGMDPGGGMMGSGGTTGGGGMGPGGMGPG